MPQTQPSTPPNWTGETVYLTGVNRSAPQSTVVGQALKAGGQGAVYRDANRPDFALKIAHNPKQEDRDRTLAMLTAAPSAQLAHYGGAPVIQIAWPQQMLLDKNGRYIGFSMRFLDMSRTTSLGAWTNRRERVHFTLSRDDRLRVNLAANLSSVTGYVHGAGHALVDLKPDNVQAYRDGYVCLLDCDGFRIAANGAVFPASVSTPNWRAPEMQSGTMPVALIGEQQDRFALALVIYQLLDNDIHPFTGIDRLHPNRSWEVCTRIERFETFLNPANSIDAPRNSHHAFFADDTLTLFRRAFLDAPDQRPTAADWAAHLREVAQRRMQSCPNDPAHWHYGKGCPWCSLQIPQPSSVVIAPGPATPSPVVVSVPKTARITGPNAAPPPAPLPQRKKLPGTSSLKSKRGTAIALFLVGTTAAAGFAYNPWGWHDGPLLKVVDRGPHPDPNPPPRPKPPPGPKPPLPPQPPSAHDTAMAEAMTRIDELERESEQRRAQLDELLKKQTAGRPENTEKTPIVRPPPVVVQQIEPPPIVVKRVEPPPISPAIASRYQSLERRAKGVRRALAGLRASQASRGWALRGDMAAFELRMDDALQAAATAIERRQEPQAIAHLDTAERAIEPLERFLNL